MDEHLVTPLSGLSAILKTAPESAVETNQTIRQMILEVLATGMLTARDISKAVGVKEKDVLAHLPHVARSVQHSGEVEFVVEPSECLSCGFVFRKRDRLKTPGKCPVCRSEEITETRFGVVGK